MNTVSNLAESASRSAPEFRYPKYQPEPGRSSSFGRETQEQQERAVSCWCCNGAGVVSPYLLRKYGIMDAAIEDPAVECMATGCRNAYISHVSSESGERRVDRRYSDDALDVRLTREDCDFIATAQLEEARMLAATAEAMPEFKSGASVIQALVKDQEPVPVKHDFVKRVDSADVEANARSSAQALEDIFGEIA